MSENTSVEKWTKKQCVEFLRNVKVFQLGNKCELILRVKSYIEHPDILSRKIWVMLPRFCNTLCVGGT